jgi:hypothetical protein
MEPTTVTCANTCTLTLVLTPATATEEQYDAINGIFLSALVALCAVWGMKRLYAVFAKPTDA